MEFKIDPDRYAGLSQEEADRQIEADRQSAFNNDPRTIAAFRSLDEGIAAREAEERRQEEEARRLQEAETEAEWEREKASKKDTWVAAGGKESEFEQAWPELRRKILLERVEELEERRRRHTLSVW